MKTVKRFRIAALSILGVLIIAAVAVGITHSTSSSKTVHGTFTPTSESLSLFGGVTDYALCSEANPAPGSQVTVMDSSGKVIGTGVLGPWSHQTVKVASLTLYECTMPFTVSGLPSESEYGFTVNGVPGTLWETNLNNVNLKVS